MPELPEIKVEAERLLERWGGHSLVSFRPLSITALKNADPPYSLAAGHALADATTRGKWLRLHFVEIDFIIHLMQGGRLKPEPRPTAKPRGGLARWTFDDADAMLFTEAGKEHRAGVWTARPGAVPPMWDDLGPDADRLGLEEFSARIRGAGGRIHNRLRDQQVIAGIGRRLANEICFNAKISPFASTKTMSDETVKAVWDAMNTAIAESLDFERSQQEMVASNKRFSRVHRRLGEACTVCGEPIRSVEYTTHTIYYCPSCQTNGTILADNTTSKFLK